jgi:hypothetical protein
LHPVRGYHPILATRADSGEVLHIRLRKGSANTTRGMLRFCDELIARVERAGVASEKLLRPTRDSGQRRPLSASTQRAGVSRSACAYKPTSAQTTLADRRLIVCRVRPWTSRRAAADTGALSLFATNRTDALTIVDAEHRQHAFVERDPRSQRQGARALPVGRFTANAAWTAIAAIAHNLLRCTTHPAPLAARAARPPHQDRAALDAAPARPLALARAFTEALTRVRSLPTTA